MSREEISWDNLRLYHAIRAQEVERYSEYDRSAILAIMMEFVESYPNGIRGSNQVHTQKDLNKFWVWFKNYSTSACYNS